LAAKLLNSYFQFTLSSGEPEPSDVAVGLDGTVYWTCKTAGVILMRSPAGVISLVEGDLENPTGLDIDFFGRLYWTEIPTPGVSGANGGRNRVVRYSPSTDQTTVVNFGDPEPQDITVSPLGDQIFWTCKSAGVIVRAKKSAR
jgi:streptogramin lyase